VSFSVAKRSINQSRLRLALKAKNEHSVFAIFSDAITTWEAAFRPKFEGVLRDTRNAAAKVAANDLKTRLQSRQARTLSHGWRVAAPSGIHFAFDDTNPKALDWIAQHAAERITNISDATREAVKDAVERAFEDQFNVDDLADELIDLVGNDDRAELIAATETMAAANAGQQEAWDQAVEDGLLTGQEQQVWITTPDERLCPICEPLDGVTAGLDDYFDVDGDQIDGPPAHPRCRCTVGLELQ
jgi:SPP1 gp7 family putative phage head morphogenesis protein